jgi:flagellar basal-body rod modification protein FlgD
MTVTPAASTTPNPTTSTDSSSAASSQTSLSGNFDTFLKLLTTQMQNQDPLNPMDSSQFTSQLVQFSGVEQAIKTNSNLENLISLTSANNLNNAMGYLGKVVNVDSADNSLVNGSATWNYSLNAPADQTNLTVTDSKGRVVYKGSGDLEAGAHTFTWNGLDNNGNQLPDGVYTLSVDAQTTSGTAVSSSITLTGPVTDVNVVSGTPELSVNGVTIDPTKIKAIHEPTSST